MHTQEPRQRRPQSVLEGDSRRHRQHQPGQQWVEVCRTVSGDQWGDAVSLMTAEGCRRFATALTEAADQPAGATLLFGVPYRSPRPSRVPGLPANRSLGSRHGAGGGAARQPVPVAGHPPVDDTGQRVHPGRGDEEAHRPLPATTGLQHGGDGILAAGVLPGRRDPLQRLLALDRRQTQGNEVSILGCCDREVPWIPADVVDDQLGQARADTAVTVVDQGGVHP